VVVPALYALWFGVRRDEPLAPIGAGGGGDVRDRSGPMPIAAE